MSSKKRKNPGSKSPKTSTRKVPVHVREKRSDVPQLSKAPASAKDPKPIAAKAVEAKIVNTRETVHSQHTAKKAIGETTARGNTAALGRVSPVKKGESSATADLQTKSKKKPDPKSPKPQAEKSERSSAIVAKTHPHNMDRDGKKNKRMTPEAEMESYYVGIREKMKGSRMPAILNTIAVTAVIGGLLCAFVITERPTFSEMEKRDLASFPSFTVQDFFQGTYTREIDQWFADTFPAREIMRQLSAGVNEYHGIRLGDVKIFSPGNTQEAQDQPLQDNAVSVPQDGSADSLPPSSQAASSQQAMEPEDDGVSGTVSNGIFVYKGKAMSLFAGQKENGAWYSRVVNAYNRNLPDVQVYNLVIPTAIEFYLPSKYADLNDSQKDMIDYIYGELDSNIKKVDAYRKLQEHKDEYVYFRTDHHWTGLGAYYAYTAFCEQAGLEPISLADTETRTLPDFIGTMYSQTQDSTLLENPDYVDYYIFPQEYSAEVYQRGTPYSSAWHTLWGEYARGQNSYSVFLHGDFPLIKVKTGNQSGRKILMVKESFGNAFAPFLINHYDEVYIVDQRYFELSLEDFIEKNGIHEVLFINNSFAACTPIRIQEIDGLRYNALMALAPVLPERPSNASSQAETSSAARSQPAYVDPVPPPVNPTPPTAATSSDDTSATPEETDNPEWTNQEEDPNSRTVYIRSRPEPSADPDAPDYEK